MPPTTIIQPPLHLFSGNLAKLSKMGTQLLSPHTLGNLLYHKHPPSRPTQAMVQSLLANLATISITGTATSPSHTWRHPPYQHQRPLVRLQALLKPTLGRLDKPCRMGIYPSPPHTNTYHHRNYNHHPTSPLQSSSAHHLHQPYPLSMPFHSKAYPTTPSLLP